MGSLFLLLFRYFRIDINCTVMGENNIAGSGSAGLFHITRVYVVDGNIIRLFCFTVEGGDGSSFIDFLGSQLASSGKYNDVRTGDIFCMEPDVSCRCFFEGELIVFFVVSSRHDLQSGRKCILERMKLLCFRASAEISVFPVLFLQADVFFRSEPSLIYCIF